MAFTVVSQARPSGDRIYYDPGFRAVIETHLIALRSPNIATSEPISPQKVHQYEGDFYGLLIEKNIPMHLHWIYLRVNGMMNPAEFGTEKYNPFHQHRQFELLHPPEDFLQELRLLYTSVRS